jgi:hypothetical protein
MVIPDRRGSQTADCSSMSQPDPLTNVRKPAIRQVQIERLIRAVKSTGENVAAISITADGTLLAHLDRGQAATWPSNEWDEVLRDGQTKRPAAKRH